MAPEGYSGPSDPAARPVGWGNVGKGGGGSHAFAGVGSTHSDLVAPPAIDPAKLIQFPYEYFKPDGANDFIPLPGFNAGQLVANNNVELARFQLRKSESGVIRSLAFGVGGFTAAGAVVFQVLIAGMPAPGWGGIFIPPQAATFVSLGYGPDETRIDVPSGALVQLMGQITAGGPFDMYATAHGWTWGTL